ncbi:hypothetical protein C3747_71g142 [Trypanosoma cruzi]|uniref:AttH domain-containing protein n=2 Tax=Trypanosoma cruzi TaxID=5693 RepID=Q4DUI7_TRYCC|nr:hypothetical protein, conserved [Trypanosoma cruzi]EAN96167.1 hypothetical protein, conserved [Trypanosoma cruzi]PWV10205.1 hypothetical protein C3747_71g142 [Trypanosoma cruzi]|eukprot:XP_818018.1 hypothetical protein [Trypanosoma cruzi strain CL Brener]
MTGERRAKQRRLEKSAADGLREQMRSSWPRVLTVEDDGTGENHVKLCVEHDAPHDHCALECWNLQGLIGENERFGLFVSFFRHAVTGEEELSDGEGSVTYAAEVSWVIVDHEKKKYYRFSELDHRAPIMAAYLAADGGITGDEYFLQALSEQFSQNRLPLPDRVMKGTTSLHTDMLDLQYGDNRLTVIPKKTGKKNTSFSWYKLSLSGTTFETGDADPQREVRVVVELTLKPTQPAVLHGNKGVVGLKDDWGHDMFHYLIPHCMVVEGTFRMMRASDDLEIARCPDLKGAKIWMSHSFGCAVPRNIGESNYLRKQCQQCGYLPHFWNCCVIHLDNETADAIGVVYALDPAHWKPVDIYVTLQSGTTGKIEHQHEGVELVAKSTSQHRSDATGILFTTQWTLITPFRDDAKLEVLLDATFPDQEFTTLFAQPSVWLGAVQVSGKIVASDGTSTGVTGKGFLQCCGKDGLNNVKKMHDMLREVSTARMEDLEVGVKDSLNEMVNSFAASATSNVKTLMSLQGQTLSDAHLVLFTSFLGVYGYIFHHPTGKKEALEAIQWCHGKWLGYFGNAYIDVKTLMLRSFMLRELSYVLKSRCASWIPTHMQVIDPVVAPPSNINAVMGKDNCSEEEVVPSLPHFGTSPSKLDLSQLRANFSGKWTLDSTRGTDNISAFLSAQGVHVLWRNLIANTSLNLFVTVDEEKQTMRFNHRRSFWGREFVIQLDGSYGEQRCASRGTIRSRACVFPGGTGVCIEKKISNQMIERDWYTFEDGGETMVEVMRLYSDKAAENKKDSPSVLPISVCVRYFTLCLERSVS